MALKILLADDDIGLRKVLEYKLTQKGYEVTSVGDGQTALKKIKSEYFDLVLSDLRMPNLSGLELLKESKQFNPNLEIILITAYATVTQAVEAVKLGAFDYLTKPFEDDQLYVTIEKAVKFQSLTKENKQLKKQLREKTSEKKIVGVSKSFKDMIQLVEKVAPSDANILLTGESGSGKEVIANMIHHKSNRTGNNFIAVNCAAIPKDLIESELFGHMKGSFTGAIKDKKGKFELANEGTLFLDEISELAIDLQAKLLRVIQERVIEPVGSETKKEIDIRLITATNIDLADCIKEGKFREDLFYRLNVIPINIPPLRERLDDIPILIKVFLKKFSQNENIEIDNEVIKILQKYNYPGNIRELENLIERMVVLRKSNKISTSDIPDDFVSNATQAEQESYNNTLTFHDAEKKLIQKTLKNTNGNKSKAAAQLKIPRHVLLYRMKKYDL